MIYLSTDVFALTIPKEPVVGLLAIKGIEATEEREMVELLVLKWIDFPRNVAKVAPLWIQSVL